MNILRRTVQIFFLGTTLALATMPALTLADDDAHHNSTSATSPDAKGGMMMGKKGMMGKGMMCDSMMCKKGMMGGGRHDMGMPGHDFSQHIEGRIAFLKTEIGITDSQAPLWNAFADALRGIAKVKADLGAAHKGAHGKLEDDSKAPSLADRLAHHETALTARLSAVKTLRDGYGKLHEKLTNSQKTTADTLVAPHVFHM